MLSLLKQQTPFEMLDSKIFKDDFTYDYTTGYKKDLNTTDVSDDTNKDGKVRIFVAIYFVIFATPCNLKYVFFS